MSYNFWEGEKIRLRAQEPREDYMNYDTEADRMGDIIHFPPARTAEPSNDEFNFIIENKNGNVVGGISTHCVNRRMGTFKYGISIKREYWGMGYATEAICIVLRYYFNELRYQKVNADVYSFNKRSIGLHQKMGFKQEGVLRRMIYTNGQYYDTILFGMTDNEFRALDS
jgi:RimJ/RimL family protein N-acetyltransferase